MEGQEHPEGWYPDPMRRQPYRRWDGAQWTAHVATAQRQVLTEPTPPPAVPTRTDARLPPSIEPTSGERTTPSASPRPGAQARQLLASAQALRARSADGRLAPTVRRKAARSAFDGVRDRLVREELAAVPLARLKETTEGRIRFGPIEAAGFTTVGQAVAAGAFGLQQVRGVGSESAIKVVAAARHLEVALRDSVRVRLDPVGRPTDHGQLLGALWDFNVATTALQKIAEPLQQLQSDLDVMIPTASRGASRLKTAFSLPRRKQETRAALKELDERLSAATHDGLVTELDRAAGHLARRQPPASELWADYERRAAFYNGLLIEIAELAPDLAAAQGFLPAEIAARVHEHPLDTSMLKNVSLRGYQVFGAKFALCQEKAMLGDEMGLGKTIEALAALSHLRAEGASHFLVVCPASVLVNWAHEARRYSHLGSYRLHGAELRHNLAEWGRKGGSGSRPTKHCRLSKSLTVSMSPCSSSTRLTT